MEYVFLLIAFSPVIVALVTGRIITRAHNRSLERREAAYLSKMFVSNLKQPPEGAKVLDSTLVIGSVILAVDKFAAALAALKKIIGGRIRIIERVVKRARREALLRAVEKAHQFGADTLINVRLETSTIFRSKQGKGSPLVEIVAYATALKTEQGVQ